jgi:enoyl-CoA hydratase/carnithine racemase
VSGYLEQRDDGVLTVTLNRPEKLNAWDLDLRVSLEDLWKKAAEDRSVRCIVLTGAGRGFCAGADVAALAGDRTARGGDIEAELAFLPGRVVEVPVVVAVNGVCAGGGLHFVADADICIAARSAIFVDSHVSVGQVSGIEPASLALRAPLGLIGRMALMGNAERVDAQRALAAGLVSEVVDDGALMQRAAEIARAIAAASPAAIRATRRVLRELSDELLRLAMIRGWDAVQKHWPHPDVKEGPRAFSEKRLPQWSE